MIGAARRGRDVLASGDAVGNARKQRRRPPWWTTLGLFALEPARGDDTGSATDREAQLRSAIRSVIPD